MALSDYKSSLIILALFFIYFQFFHHSHQSHSTLQITSDSVLFHSNWTKSLDDICCLSKFHDALKLQGIKNLDVSLSMSSSLNEDDLRTIFSEQKLSYQSIKLDFSGMNISNSGIDYVLSLIQNDVQSLQLNLNGLPTQSGFGKSLAQKLNQFIALKSLKISLIMAVKNIEVDSFFAHHRPTKSLTSLHLILIGNQIAKDGLEHLQEYLSTLELKDLHFNLYANKIGFEGAQILGKALNNQSALQRLHVDLYFNNITEIGTENITLAVQNLKSLKHLELNLDFNYIKNEGGKAVGKMLQGLTGLQTLSLGVASKNFGYLGYKHVISGLEKLTQLKGLILRCGINRVGTNGAEITKQMLTKLNNLDHLQLSFIQNYIGDDGIGLLAEQVSSMQKLKKVSLNLAFNDAKSFGLIKTIKSFLNSSYDNLQLSLSSNEFRDSEVKLIEQHLTTLIKNNKEFKFDFTDTAISKTEVQRLKKVFSQANNKFGKSAKLSVNSIIPEQQPAKPAAKAENKKVEKTPLQDAKNKSQQQPVKQQQTPNDTLQATKTVPQNKGQQTTEQVQKSQL